MMELINKIRNTWKKHPIALTFLVLYVLWLANSASPQIELQTQSIFGTTTITVGVILIVLAVVALVSLFFPPFGWVVSMLTISAMVILATSGALIIELGKIIESAGGIGMILFVLSMIIIFKIFKR